MLKKVLSKESSQALMKSGKIENMLKKSTTSVHEKNLDRASNTIKGLTPQLGISGSNGKMDEFKAREFNPNFNYDNSYSFNDSELSVQSPSQIQEADKESEEQNPMDVGMFRSHTPITNQTPITLKQPYFTDQKIEL